MISIHYHPPHLKQRFIKQNRTKVPSPALPLPDCQEVPHHPSPTSPYRLLPSQPFPSLPLPSCPIPPALLARLAVHIIEKSMQVSISGKSVKQFCSETAQVVEAVDRQGAKLFAKLISIERSEQKGFDECLQFNNEVLQDLDELIFKEHFLAICAQVSNEEMMGLVTDPYDCNLAQLITTKLPSEQECMEIFDQLLRAAYSLVMNGYWHRNLRAEHFVRCGKIWKLESLVYSEDYSRAEGFSSEYLWSSKHEPPEFVPGKQYQDEDYNSMMVWNLGSILLHMLVGTHRLSNKDVTVKFKNKPFTFEAIGIKSDRVTKLSQNTKDLLGGLLHYDPLQRTRLHTLFENRYASETVAKHYQQHKQAIPASKIAMGRSIRNSKLNFESKSVLKDISTSLAQREKEKEKLLVGSRINSVVDDEDFLDNLQEISNKIPSKEYKFGGGKDEGQNPQGIQDLMSNKNHLIRKSLQLYKSYYDQSQLLVLAIENIDKLQFLNFKEDWQVREVRLLVKYAVLFVSLVNLNSLAEGFNQSRNILDLDGDQFTAFQNSHEYSAFQKFVNFKRGERNKELEALRQELTFLKKRNLSTKDQRVFDLMQRDYKKTNFQEIKTAYRLILKYAYDSISEQYNRYKKTEQGLQLAQRAMFVTYCLTIDKLYIKEHIPDNFKFYFEWLSKPASNYVPLNDFKQYILNAPKEVLIENSRYILKKYYNI